MRGVERKREKRGQKRQSVENRGGEEIGRNRGGDVKELRRESMTKKSVGKLTRIAKRKGKGRERWGRNGKFNWAEEKTAYFNLRDGELFY